jgi:hypothetical protein
MVLFLLAIPLLVEVAQDEFRLRFNLQIAALAIVGILILVSKASVGVIFWGAAGYLLWRQLGLTLLNGLKLGLPILALIGVVASFGSPDSSYITAVKFLDFAKEYPRGAWPNIVANLLLLCLAWQVWRAGSAPQKKLAEAFAVMAVGSLLPALLLNVTGGSNFYFANVGTWAGIVLLSSNYDLTARSRRLTSALKPSLIVVALVLLSLCTEEKRTSLKVLARQFADLRVRAHTLIGLGPVADEKTSQLLIELLSPAHSTRANLAGDVKRVSGAQTVQTLISAGALRESHSLLFVPPENDAFWSTYADCRSDPFFIPAALGVPMLNGINPTAPAKLACAWNSYYFIGYTPDSASVSMSDEKLCSHATGFNFSSIYILSNQTSVRKLSCITGVSAIRPG